MIRHMVFFNAKNHDDLDEILAGLRILQDIPHASLLEVEQNNHTDHFSKAVDVVVYGEFTDQAALEAFKAHPIYQQSINRVRPLRDLRMAADYQVPFTK